MNFVSEEVALKRGFITGLCRANYANLRAENMRRKTQGAKFVVRILSVNNDTDVTSVAYRIYEEPATSKGIMTSALEVFVFIYLYNAGAGLGKMARITNLSIIADELDSIAKHYMDLASKYKETLARLQSQRKGIRHSLTEKAKPVEKPRTLRLDPKKCQITLLSENDLYKFSSIIPTYKPRVTERTQPDEFSFWSIEGKAVPFEIFDAIGDSLAKSVRPKITVPASEVKGVACGEEFKYKGIDWVLLDGESATTKSAGFIDTFNDKGETGTVDFYESVVCRKLQEWGRKKGLVG